MENGIQETKTGENGETKEVQQQPTVSEQQQEPKQQKAKGWLKRHWKGVAAAGTGIGAAVVSAFVAYKRGKAAGINSVPVPEPEDYSLNPNE